MKCCLCSNIAVETFAQAPVCTTHLTKINEENEKYYRFEIDSTERKVWKSLYPYTYHVEVK